MPEAALSQRTGRERWAAPGSGHDRVIGLARAALPMSIGVLGAFLVAAPLTMGGDVSFVLDKNKVALATERMRLQTALYRGQDDKGQPFTLSAGSAVQKSSAEPIVQLQQLAAQIVLADGPARLKSDAGRYNMESQQVASDGPVNFTSANGFDLTTSKAVVDLKARVMHGAGGVTGKGPQGSFSADRMQADLETHQVMLDGNVRLRIRPGRTR